jgi:hypothetical protein
LNRLERGGLGGLVSQNAFGKMVLEVRNTQSPIGPWKSEKRLWELDEQVHFLKMEGRGPKQISNHRMYQSSTGGLTIKSHLMTEVPVGPVFPRSGQLYHETSWMSHLGSIRLKSHRQIHEKLTWTVTIWFNCVFCGCEVDSHHFSDGDAMLFKLIANEMTASLIMRIRQNWEAMESIPMKIFSSGSSFVPGQSSDIPSDWFVSQLQVEKVFRWKKLPTSLLSSQTFKIHWMRFHISDFNPLDRRKVGFWIEKELIDSSSVSWISKKCHWLFLVFIDRRCGR